MKKFVLAACLILFVLFSCKKQETGCTPVKPELEEPQILAYAAKDSILAIKHSSGIYYQIIDSGSGATPTPHSNVSVIYTGKFLNDSKFDESKTPVKLSLSDVIEGWQIGIPLIKKGGRIKLIIPSAYAYGCNGSGPIPGNSVLFFDVTLEDVE